MAVKKTRKLHNYYEDDAFTAGMQCFEQVV